jgi:hypothetical protein
MFIAFVMMANMFVIMTILYAAGISMPDANRPPVVEQSDHTIRYLAKFMVLSEEPNVWLLEVDGKKFVVVQSKGVAIAPLEGPAK